MTVKEVSLTIGIRDIASAAGVSISTVSNVMNNRHNVGEETRQRVLQLCKEMNYVPNAAGKSLKSGTSKTILFSFSEFGRSFYLKIIEGINDYVSSAGYDLMICTTRSCEKYMRNNNLSDGCIVLDAQIKSETLMRAAGEFYPIVVLDRPMQSPFIKSVIVNNYIAMTSLMTEIVARGYRHFAFIGGPEHTDDAKERFQAFQDVLAEHGISFNQEYYFSGNYRNESGYRGARIFLMGRKPPEIIVCANDSMAIGAIKALEEAGLKIPNDVAVTGFDDVDEAATAKLTTIKIPNYERGYLAAHSLIENINGKKNAETLKIPASVVWRDTVSSRI